MLKLDQNFYDTYFKYYGKMSPFKVVDSIRDIFEKWSTFTLSSAINVAKTSSVLNQTYSDFYIEMGNRQPGFVRKGENAERDVFSVAFYYIYKADLRILEDFLSVRFIARDIYRELATQAYGVSNEENIEKIKAIKTEDTYSIQAPNPISRDRWFYNLTVTVGSYSKCHSRKIGAVLVKDNSVISTGYNGPPRGVPTCDQRWYIDEQFKEGYGHHTKPDEAKGTTPQDTKGICPRRIIGFPSGEGLSICPAGHAERNALINAARLGIKTDKTKLYMSCAIPCTPCMVEIINSGVEEIVCSSMHVYDETAMYLLENSDLKVRLFDFLV